MNLTLMAISTAIFLIAPLLTIGSNGALAQEQKPQIGQQFIFNEKSKPANDPDTCASYGEKLSAKAIPDYNLCDIVVYRQAPPIVRSDGMVLNNFSGIAHYIEFLPATINNTGTFSANVSSNNTSAAGENKTVVAFGEFALIDPEVVPVQQVMAKYNWTMTSLHHHMLDEVPKVLFLHWSVTGNPDELVKQAKEIMDKTSTYDQAKPDSRTPTTAGP